MIKSKRLVISFSLVSIFAAMSLLALAEEQTNKKPAPKAQAVQPKGSAVGSHPPMGPGHPIVGPAQHTVRKKVLAAAAASRALLTQLATLP
jgi:hypothetical protein